MNGTLNMPSQSAIEMMETTFNNPNSWEGLSATAWLSMRRLADRLDPDYQTTGCKRRAVNPAAVVSIGFITC